MNDVKRSMRLMRSGSLTSHEKGIVYKAALKTVDWVLDQKSMGFIDPTGSMIELKFKELKQGVK